MKQKACTKSCCKERRKILNGFTTEILKKNKKRDCPEKLRPNSKPLQLYQLQKTSQVHCKYFDCTEYSFWQCYIPTVIWLYIVQSKTLFNLKLYSSMSVSVICTAIGCNNHCQITVGNGTQPMTVNWL